VRVGREHVPRAALDLRAQLTALPDDESRDEARMVGFGANDAIDGVLLDGGIEARHQLERLAAGVDDEAGVLLAAYRLAKPVVTQVSSVAAIWAVEGALLIGILTVVLFALEPLKERFAEGSKSAVAGALLASINTASEYGFGGVIAGITGSASGGMSIALATMAESFISAAQSAGIPLEVLHRVAAMASGGMDTLPHIGAVTTLLGVTGLTHKESYRDIFAITLAKTAAVAVVIGAFYLTGIY
jgi:H+/gluconate symporter-like permease